MEGKMEKKFIKIKICIFLSMLITLFVVMPTSQAFFDDGTMSLLATNPTGVVEPAIPIYHNNTLIDNENHKAIEAFDNVPGTDKFPLTFVDLHANTFMRLTYQKDNGDTATLGTSIVGSTSFRPPTNALQFIPEVVRGDVYTNGQERYESAVSGTFGSVAEISSGRTFPDPVIGLTKVSLSVYFKTTRKIQLSSDEPFPGNDRFRVVTISSMFSDSKQFDANIISYEDINGHVKKIQLTT